ncbi:caspase, EACC1-associated type [Actinokineospora inagensis]|uniref:caspase, EACC1-associated type n=1 Tax=Actinokineospora inagensis TaxID=103730 RepID=UPI000405B386|nr:caspase family protein [Actinokineospora inagensis]
MSSRAVLIGTSSYRDARLPDIPVVPRCLTDLARAFADLAPTVLLDQPDLSALSTGLTAAMHGVDDVLLVYYVGHGIVGRKHELYLGMPGTDYEHPSFGSLPYDALRDRVLDSPAATKIVILDCCFSGRALGEPLADPAGAVVGQLAIDGTYLLTSTESNRVSLVLPGEPHTAFTGRLLRVLDTGIPDAGDHLTIDEVYTHLLAAMTSAGLPRPQKRGTRTADRYPIAPNRARAESPDTLRDRLAAVLVKARTLGWRTVADDLDDIHTRQSRLLAADDPELLRTRAHLHFAHAARGPIDPAGDHLTEVCDDQQRILHDDKHPDLLITYYYMATCAAALGDPEQLEDAVDVLRIATPAFRHAFGYATPETSRAHHVLARCLAMTVDESGTNLQEAISILEELTTTRAASLPATDPVLTQTRQDLAATNTAGPLTFPNDLWSIA